MTTTRRAHVRVRASLRAAALAGGLTLGMLAPAAFAAGGPPPVGGAEIVSGVVAQQVGVSIDASGAVSGAGTLPVTVTRERRGDQLIITVTPR